MSEFVRVILAVLFLPFVFLLIHKYISGKSNNGLFSKYYLKPKSNYKSLGINFINEKIDITISFIITLIVIVTVSIFFTTTLSNNKLFIDYCLSLNSLRLTKHILDIIITATFSAIGLLTLFLTLKKEYYIFFSKEDVINKMKIKKYVVNTLLFATAIFIGSAIFYGMHYDLVPSTNEYKSLTFVLVILLFVIFFIFVNLLVPLLFYQYLTKRNFQF